MFYDQFVKMCAQKKVTPNKALVDCKISRTSVAKWKKGATPNGANVQKLAEYFGVSAGYLLGAEIEKAPIPEGERELGGLSDVYFSLAKDLQDARIDPEDIRNFACIIAKNMQKEEGSI